MCFSQVAGLPNEDEVQGLSRAYLERQPRETSSTWTESRRVLGPPKGSAARPRPPPPPPSRRSDVRTAGLSASITAPSLGSLPPPQVPSFKTGTRPRSLVSGGSRPNVVEKMPPLRHLGDEGRQWRRVASSKQDFLQALTMKRPKLRPRSAKTGIDRLRVCQLSDPGYLSFNPSSRLNPDVPRAQGSGEQPDVVGEQAAGPFPEVGTPRGGYARPTPKLKDLARAQLSRQGSEQGNPKGPQPLEPTPEPADPKVSSCPVGSPEPAGPKGSVIPIGSSEPVSPKVPSVRVDKSRSDLSKDLTLGCDTESVNRGSPELPEQASGSVASDVPRDKPVQRELQSSSQSVEQAASETSVLSKPARRCLMRLQATLIGRLGPGAWSIELKKGLQTRKQVVARGMEY